MSKRHQWCLKYKRPSFVHVYHEIKDIISIHVKCNITELLWTNYDELPLGTCACFKPRPCI